MTLAVHLLNSLSAAGKKEAGPDEFSGFDPRSKDVHQGWQVVNCLTCADSHWCRGEAWDRRRRVRRQTCAVHTMVAAPAHHTSTYPADDHSPIFHPGLWRKTGKVSQ